MVTGSTRTKIVKVSEHLYDYAWCFKLAEQSLVELVEVTDNKVVHSDKIVRRSLTTRPSLRGQRDAYAECFWLS